jgi:hypothetical protein
MDNLLYRGQEPENRGIAPIKMIDTMVGVTVPTEFEFEAVFGDMIMAEIVDEDADGNVFRDGIWVSQNVTKKLWRRARVVLKGPDCKNIEVGDDVAYPSDKGIPMVSANKKKYIFLDMSRLFGKLKKLDVT